MGLYQIIKMLTNKDIEKFQQIYKVEFGTEISKEAAAEQGLKLVTLMSHVYKPMTLEEYKNIEQKRSDTKNDLVTRLAEDKKSGVKYNNYE